MSRKNMKLINARIHGILDYIVVAALWFSSSLPVFTPWVAKFTMALGFVHLLLTLFTDFSAGLFKIVPLKIHGLIEFSVAVILIISPWLLEIKVIDRVFYEIFGVIVLVTFVFTDYKKMES